MTASASSPFGAASVQGTVAIAFTVTRDPNNKGVLTRFDANVPGCVSISGTCITAGQLVGKSQRSPTGGSWEVGYVQSVTVGLSCAGLPTPNHECINAWLRYGAAAGAYISGGGLIGSYVVFPDYNQTVSGTTYRYAQNVFANTSNTLTFGALRTGGFYSYPENSGHAPTTFSYQIYQGGDVEDVRDPNGTCSQASKATMQADGCWFMVEDNNATWTSGGTGATVENTNHISALYHLDQFGLDAQNPYSFVTEHSTVFNGNAGGYSGATGYSVVNNMPKASLSAINSSGLYYPPAVMLVGGSSPVGAVLLVNDPPIGSLEGQGFANHADVLGVSAYWALCSNPAPGGCSLDTASGNYYWDHYNLFEQLGNSDIGTARAQADVVYRSGQRTIQDFGTTFEGGAGNTNPMVTAVAATSATSAVVAKVGPFQGPLLTPASSSATCTTGQIEWDTNYIYVCTATNTWKRSALTTF